MRRLIEMLAVAAIGLGLAYAVGTTASAKIAASLNQSAELVTNPGAAR